MLLRIILAGLSISAIAFLGAITVYAQPYGHGKYDAAVPYGGETALSIATSGDLALTVAPTGSDTLGVVAGTVTVTSSDVSGYQLYARALGSSDMVSGSAVLGASSNVSAAPLMTNTWGYNLDGSTNFLGLSTTDSLLKSTTDPFTTGDITTVTYGVMVDSTQEVGSYSGTILYTAVPRTD